MSTASNLYAKKLSCLTLPKSADGVVRYGVLWLPKSAVIIPLSAVIIPLSALRSSLE